MRKLFIIILASIMGATSAFSRAKHHILEYKERLYGTLGMTSGAIRYVTDLNNVIDLFIGLFSIVLVALSIFHMYLKIKKEMKADKTGAP